MNRNLLNALTFQVAWWTLLVFQSYQNQIGVIAFGFAFAFLQIFLKTEQRWFSAAKWSFITALGFLFDIGTQFMGWIQFPSTPWWLILVWFQFACTLNQSLSYFNKNKFIAFWGGFVFGPLSYFAASKWNVFTYTPIPENILYHAVSWGLVFIVFLKIAAAGESKNASRIQ